VQSESQLAAITYHDETADAPVTQLDTANSRESGLYDDVEPQPRDFGLAQLGAVDVLGRVMVTSRALVDQVTKNSAVFAAEALIDQGNTRPLLPISIDPPAHVNYRKLLDPLFAPKRMDAIEDDVTERVNHFIDQFVDRGHCNFTDEVADKFPPSVFLGLMGLPWEELDTFLRLRDGLIRPGTPEMTNAERTQFQLDTGQEVYAYFDAILDERAEHPHDDLLTHFLHAECDGERLTRNEILDICFMLLIAGLDTVADSMTCAWAFLAQHPEHRRQLVEDPEIIPNAVEELLRWNPPTPIQARWARQRCTINGLEVPAGEIVYVNMGAANVDPESVPDPLEVRFDRDVNRHLSFGGGVHRCLGSHLARRELRIALREWHRRIPEYTLAPGYEARFGPPPLRFVPDLQLAWPVGG
jgi:cytochrome P450